MKTPPKQNLFVTLPANRGRRHFPCRQLTMHPTSYLELHASSNCRQFVKHTSVALSCLAGSIHCTANRTTDSRRAGIAVAVEWPETLVGLTRLVLCPFAYGQPTYAQRDCRFSSERLAPAWTEPDLNSCPYPPLTQDVDTLAAFMV